MDGLFVVKKLLDDDVVAFDWLDAAGRNGRHAKAGAVHCGMVGLVGVRGLITIGLVLAVGFCGCVESQKLSSVPLGCIACVIRRCVTEEIVGIICKGRSGSYS